MNTEVVVPTIDILLLPINGTALHLAIYYGKLEIVKLLLDNKAGISKLLCTNLHVVTSKHQKLKLSLAATLIISS